MSISIKKYVDITSGVGAGGGVRQRDLIGRLFTTNTKVPVDGLVETTSATDALTYFGSTSKEYLMAAFYFTFIAKNVSRAKKLSYARYADVAAAPRIYGAKLAATLAQFVAVTAGTLTITSGANTANLTGLNFSAATSLANVASILQTAIRAATGSQFTTATVTYDAVGQAFNFVGSTPGAAAMSVTVTGTGADVATLLGWGLGSVMSPGTAAKSITNTLSDSAEASNNFGSFAFLPVLTDTQVVEAATWNATRNVEFVYCVPVTDANMAGLSAALLATAGVALTYAPLATEYDEIVPMILMASTDYTRRNAVKNYMFQQFALTPKVTTTAISTQLDNLRVNYYGVTQTAGQLIAFYQRGTLTGGASAPVDQNVYANELWFKDVAQASLMSLLLALERVSANIEGRGQIITILQDAIEQALYNGAISVGKALNVQQRLYITELTGDDLAYAQVQNIGYWLSCDMQSYVTVDGRTEFKAVYLLVYSKDDVIRKVEGSHVLI